MGRGLAEGWWLHAVTFVVLALLTARCVEKLTTPPVFRDVSIDQLVANPPLGKRIRVQCDQTSTLGYVTVQKGSQDATLHHIVGICELGQYVLPIVVKHDDALS